MCFITTMFMTDQKPNRCYSFVQFLCFVCPYRENFFSFTFLHQDVAYLQKTQI